MSDVNEEMKAVANYAVDAAKKRYNLDLDYSEQSISGLDKILEKIYWGFSGHAKDEGEGGLIYNTAIIWGSYLGEYIRLKWGGTWITKDSYRLLSVNNVEYSPINVVYQKISRDPESSLESYINEIKIVMYRLAIHPQQAQELSKNITQFKQEINVRKTKKPITIDKKLLYSLAGVGGLLLVVAVSIIGYVIFRSRNIPASYLPPSATSTYTAVAVVNTSVPISQFPTDTQSPSITPLPSYTPKPTNSPSPTYTRSPTPTQIPTFTPTQTPSPFPTNPPTPRNTRTPTPTLTLIPTEPPTFTPTNPPTFTPTEPPPSPTVPPPIVIESCDVDPSTVQAGFTVILTFSVHFSGPGYGFDTELDPEYPGASGCSGFDDNGDGTAECNGSSGMLPNSSTVNVLFSSSVGNCSASYSAP